MISSLTSLPVGNAVQITVSQIPFGTVIWRVLRNLTGIFPAWNDPISVVVGDFNIDDPQLIVDAGLPGTPTAPGLVNGVPVYYQLFYFDGSVWTADTEGAQSCTPQTTYLDESIDAQTIVLNRVTVGIAAALARQQIVLPPTNPGPIKVLSAPPVFSEELRWPVISVHMDKEAPLNRALDEFISNDEFNELEDQWDDREGWQSRTNLSVIGYSLNPDERILLRRILRSIIIANLRVFDSMGLEQIEFSQSDTEQFVAENASVYMTVGTFSCTTPLVVNAPVNPITDVEVTVYPTIDGIVGPAFPNPANQLTDEFGNLLLTEVGNPISLEL